ncbi:MAG: hypothetical protein KDA96_26765, partial [Planctomycetaceae bacterium]|nr:hypothetical protein [Planctomycetaceae bacterium]
IRIHLCETRLNTRFLREPDANAFRLIRQLSIDWQCPGGDATWVWNSFTCGLNPFFIETCDGRVLRTARPQDEAPRRSMGQAPYLSRIINLAKSTRRNDPASTGDSLAEPGVSDIIFAPEGGDHSGSE